MRYLVVPLLIVLLLAAVPRAATAELRAGAARVDVTPIQFPVLVNGNMLTNRADRATSPLHARAIVLDDGRERAAIVVVDTCMMPRDLLDDVKHRAAQRAKIRPDRMLISATHTHTAPAAMGCLGVDADPTYVPYLREKIAEAIAEAEANLAPARVGWAAADAADYTALRRWVIRPDRVALDPFGNPTVRANMHAGANWDNVTGESGPEDPALSLIALQALDGRPIAALANFSMHYFSGPSGINADYFGLFCAGLEERVGGQAAGDRLAAGDQPPFVAIMSHGCSGDIWRRDYTRPPPAAGEEPTIETYTRGLLDIATGAYGTVEYAADADLAMAETRLPLKYRVPDQQRLEWARRIVDAMGDRLPETTEEVYAREQIYLHEAQSTDVVVQAIRIGDIGIATTSTETYALTGLKLKLQSPLPRTMVIELANGADGYIPPPEQHVLGGYNTWAARTAGLEVSAEPKIAEAALSLLEQVADRPRRRYQPPRGPAAESLLAARPAAYFRLDEFAGRRAIDCSGNGRHALYEPGVVFFLEGPNSASFCGDGETNRAVHFAGGRIDASLALPADRYSVSLWFWNGMPADGRETAGWLFSHDQNHGLGPWGEHVGVGGTATQPGKLIFQHGNGRDGGATVAGRTTIDRWTWNHLLFVRDSGAVRLYLNGDPRPEIETDAPLANSPPIDQWFFGGRSDNQDNWEGRLDEIAVFDRALTPTALPMLYLP